MSEGIFFLDKDIEITDSFVRGKKGAYQLGSIVGLEARFPLRPLLVSGIVALCQLQTLTYLDDGLLRTVVFATWMVNLLVFWSLWFVRPVFLRTASGTAPLGIMRNKYDRGRIVEAFVCAKKFAAEMHEARSGSA